MDRGRGRGAGLKRPRGDFSPDASRGGRGGKFRGGRSRFENRSHGAGGGRGRGGSMGERPRPDSSFRRNPMAGGYRPQVAEESVPVHAQQRAQAALQAERGRGGFARATRGGGSHSSGPVARRAKEGRDVIVILEKAGLLLGNMGLVDAYERAATTELLNPSLRDVRPDIVHQCLLALCDSDLAYQHRLRIYISLFNRSGKVIEVSPALRPPRTYGRFRGLMATLLRDGRVASVEGQTLMRVMPGSVAPVIPNGAEVIGLGNQLTAPVFTASQLGAHAHAHPVDDALQGGVKGVEAFYCISCTDDCNMDGIDYLTRSVCLSAYPTAAHVMCARICEGHTRATSAT